jgi:hypothetical protein
VWLRVDDDYFGASRGEFLGQAQCGVNPHVACPDYYDALRIHRSIVATRPP